MVPPHVVVLSSVLLLARRRGMGRPSRLERAAKLERRLREGVMEQEALGTCGICSRSEVAISNEFGEQVCETCALDLHVSNTAARVIPGYFLEDGTWPLWVVLIGGDGSETSSRTMTTAEMQSFITRAQTALDWARAMEADDGE